MPRPVPGQWDVGINQLPHQLLGVDTLKSLMTHPKVGASWEGLVTNIVSEVMKPAPTGMVLRDTVRFGGIRPRIRSRSRFS